MFSAYMLDPEHGWLGVHRLPLDNAIRYCKEYRARTAGCLVVIVPDGESPNSYFAFVIGLRVPWPWQRSRRNLRL